MKSDTINVKGAFQDRRQYRVPFYQRAYVWGQENQWAPLWNDITDKAGARLENEEVPAPHFLGAIVLEPQLRVGLRGVDMVHVIDGQQRLTTLQYVLAAIALVMRENNLVTVLPVISDCLWNPNLETMTDAEVEKYKLWPTFRDRQTHKAAITSETRVVLRERFPESFTKSGTIRRQGIPHPPALDAIWYFASQIDVWLKDKDDKAKAVEVLAEATLQDLKFVAISLEPQDDAQVIFETLNGRGAQLMPTDLIRNFIFMKADKRDGDPHTLYETLWSQFEDGFWSEEQRRGRMTRPRREWFVQSALQAKMGEDIDVGRLYQGYRQFAEKVPSATEQLQFLSNNAAHYKQLVGKFVVTPIGWFGSQIDSWDASALQPVALLIAQSGLTDDQQHEIFLDLVSFVVRRAVCGLTTKSYNKTFAQLLRRLREGNISPIQVRAVLGGREGNASRWPTDDDFKSAWLNQPIIERLGSISRVRYLLAELEKALRPNRTDDKVMSDLTDLDVEHVMPVTWFEHWPLAGVLATQAELSEAVSADLFALDNGETTDRQKLLCKRKKLVQTVGNLTLLHYGVNRSIQNYTFSVKRERLLSDSNLMLNRDLMVAPDWDEDKIEQRGLKLFELAKKIWPGPPAKPDS